jgi:hypothetical protein
MEQQRDLNTLGKFVRTFAIWEIAIFGGVALICYFGGWRTWSDYATGLFIAGTVVMGIGAFSVMGTNRVTGDVTIRYIETVSDENMKQRNRRYFREMELSRILAFKSVFIGIVPFLVGIALTFLMLGR